MRFLIIPIDTWGKHRSVPLPNIAIQTSALGFSKSIVSPRPRNYQTLDEISSKTILPPKTLIYSGLDIRDKIAMELVFPHYCRVNLECPTTCGGDYHRFLGAQMRKFKTVYTV